MGKNESVQTIIFDLDGTVADTLPDIVYAVSHTLEQVGCPPQPEEFIRKSIGGGAKNLIKKALGEDKKDLFDSTLQMFTEYYKEHAAVRTTLYPGVKEIFDYYHGKKKMAIATFKAKEGTMAILEHFDLLGYFDMVVTVSDVKKAKPDPECIQMILDKLGDNPGQAMLVGDTLTDMQTGKNAGVVTCAVTYGYGELEDIKNSSPDYIIDSFDQLKEIV